VCSTLVYVYVYVYVYPTLVNVDVYVYEAGAGVVIVVDCQSVGRRWARSVGTQSRRRAGGDVEI
jgi:hypothetical protein